jgi:putative membrane protein
MRFITKLILSIVANALAIFLAAKYIIPQYMTFTGYVVDYLTVGLILALANIFIRPILKIVSAPLIFITMGLFLIVINIIILFAVDWFVEALIIISLWGYLWGSIIIAIVNAVIVKSFKKKPATIA